MAEATRLDLSAHAERMAALGDMASGIAHEINNPLTWVLGSLDLLGEELRTAGVDADDGVSVLVKDARQGARRIADIVHGLQSFSRPPPRDTTQVRLDAQIEEALRLTGNQIRHRAVLERSIETVRPVHARPTDLVQLFAGLLTSAAESIPVGSATDHCIRVSLSQDPSGAAVVEISDDGRGMSQEEVRGAFDPFRRHKTLPAGLGLSVGHTVVTGLGGRIEIASELGKGTTVRVTIPTVPEGLAEPRRTALAPAHAEHTGSVLVIDDEPAICKLASRALNEMDVLTFQNGRDALAFLEEGIAPDVILCDIMMPDLTGRDVYQTIAHRWPELRPRIILLTGGAFTQDISDWVDSLDNLLVEKPFGIRELREIVRGRVFAPA